MRCSTPWSLTWSQTKMANNYTDFSCALPLDNEEQRKWLEAELTDGYMHKGEWFDETEGPSIDDAEFVGTKFLHDYEDRQDSEEYAGFVWEFCEDHDHLWMHTSEGGNTGHVAHLAQKFLKKFDPQSHFAFTWAYYCSKPRLDEQGGGAAVVTAEKIYWDDAYCWADEKIGELIRFGKLPCPSSKPLEMREVEYWRCWAGNGGDSGQWDTSFIKIPVNTPDEELDAAVQVCVQQDRVDRRAAMLRGLLCQLRTLRRRGRRCRRLTKRPYVRWDGKRRMACGPTPRPLASSTWPRRSR